jgi:hypothetical protein
MPKGVRQMKEFIGNCFDHYAMLIVVVLWIPLMIIALPIAMVAVCMKTAYAVISDMFGVEDE